MRRFSATLFALATLLLAQGFARRSEVISRSHPLLQLDDANVTALIQAFNAGAVEGSIPILESLTKLYHDLGMNLAEFEVFLVVDKSDNEELQSAKDQLVALIASSSAPERRARRGGARLLQNVDPSRWMTERWNELSNKPLSQIRMPGSHNAACYDSDIPLDVLGIVSGLVENQSLDIKEQLDAGVREFDLRAMWRDGNSWWTHHSEYACVPLSDVLSAFREWAIDHKSSGGNDVVTLIFQHAVLDDQTGADLANAIFSGLGTDTIVPPLGNWLGWSTVGEFAASGTFVLVCNECQAADSSLSYGLAVRSDPYDQGVFEGANTEEHANEIIDWGFSRKLANTSRMLWIHQSVMSANIQALNNEANAQTMNRYILDTKWPTYANDADTNAILLDYVGEAWNDVDTQDLLDLIINP